MSSLFKHPSQTTPIKVGPLNAPVGPEKPAKREKGNNRTENSSRSKNFCHKREGEGERRARERGVLLATEGIFVARKPEEREKDVGREREREIKREKEGRRGREENSSCYGNNFCRKRDRARACTRAQEKGRGEACASPPDSPRDGILFRCERETFAEEERKQIKRRRGERKLGKERERGERGRLSSSLLFSQ